MAIGTTYPHIEKPPDRPAHLARYPRIRVAQIVMDYLAHGWSPDEMCRQHSYLSLSEAHSAMVYYYDHQAEIDAEIRDELAAVALDRQHAKDSPFVTRMRAQGRL